jgi:hypothetical protein
MLFMSLIKHNASHEANPPKALMDAMDKLIEQETKAGVLVHTGGLAAAPEGIYARSSGGKMSVKDGPFTEAKEVVGGYAILKVGSREEAVEKTRAFVDLHIQHWPEFEFECETRQIFGPPEN